MAEAVSRSKAIVPRAIALRTRCVESARFWVPAFAGTTVMGPCRANLAPSGPWHAPNAIALQLYLNLCTLHIHSDHVSGLEWVVR